MSDCCAAPPGQGAVFACPVNGEKGKPVGLITLQSLLTEDALKRLNPERTYYFCAGRDCPVVYFSDDPALSFEKSDVKVRVGQKETEGPIPVCYCFGHTEESVAEEIAETGTSTAVESITAKVKAQECACEVNNPQGSCCLGNVHLAVKKANSLLLAK